MVSALDLGYRRVTVERPLRLAYQMTGEGKARFLDAHPRLLGDLQLIDEVLGRGRRDWTDAWEEIGSVLGARSEHWTQPERRAFREVFGTRDATAKPVSLPDGALEPDPELRDSERVPLTDAIESFIEREVRPFAPDAWVSGVRIGYEISFSRLFPEVPDEPRSIDEVDGELREVGDRIGRLLDDLLK
jgi:type I restriction enzyme M protein